MPGHPNTAHPTIAEPTSWHITTLVYVVHRGRLLLMRRRKQPNLGLWSPPGGKIEPGESPLAAALRELEEETGLVGRRPRLAAIVSELDATKREAWLMFAVRAEASTTTIAGDEREGECRWIDLEEVGSLEMPPADPHILRAVLDERPGVSFVTVRLDEGELISIESRRAG